MCRGGQLRRGHGGLAPLPPRRKTMVWCRKQEGHVCRVTQQTCLLCHTEDMYAESQSRHVCCITQQTCPLFHAADNFCSVTQQTCLLCHTATMSAVSHDRLATQQTCLLCPPTENYCLSALPRSAKRTSFCKPSWQSTNRQSSGGHVGKPSQCKCC